MKYKVIYSINSSGGGNPDGMAAQSFYTRAQAVSSCEQWAAIAPGQYTADFWDGNSWTRYYIVP